MPDVLNRSHRDHGPAAGTERKRDDEASLTSLKGGWLPSPRLVMCACGRRAERLESYFLSSHGKTGSCQIDEALLLADDVPQCIVGRPHDGGTILHATWPMPAVLPCHDSTELASEILWLRTWDHATKLRSRLLLTGCFSHSTLVTLSRLHDRPDGLLLLGTVLRALCHSLSMGWV